jgi:alpha-L-fucosidase
MSCLLGKVGTDLQDYSCCICKEVEMAATATKIANPQILYGGLAICEEGGESLTEGSQTRPLGQNDKVVEYHPEITPKSTFHQEKDGLHIRVMAAQRIQDNFRWPNPTVIKISNVEPAFTPPQVETLKATRTGSSAMLEGKLDDMGDSTSLEAAFEYRPILGEDVNSRSSAWIATPTETLSKPGAFTAKLENLDLKGTYEFRAVIHHPLLNLYGQEQPLK